MEALGYAAAVLMGGTLGLMGGGGSILAVPILVYLFHIPPVVATGYSLFLVGLTSLFGIVGYARKQQVNVKVGLFFSIPALLGVFSARKFVVPALPEILFSIADRSISRDLAMMVLFALMMLVASFSMIRGRQAVKAVPQKHAVSEYRKVLLVITEGLVVGLLTGLVGAGGGFLVIPVLVLLAGLDMKEAVGTSLVVIAIKSLTGFLGELGGAHPIDWMFLGGFSVFTTLGVFVGSWLSTFVSGDKLKPIFGWFVLIMGFVILYQSAQGLSATH